VLIKYKFKFEKDGLTIIQSVGQPAPLRARSAPADILKDVADAKHLRSAFSKPADGAAKDDAAAKGGGDGDEISLPGQIDTGAGGPGSGAITIIGPIVFGGWGPMGGSDDGGGLPGQIDTGAGAPAAAPKDGAKPEEKQ